MLRSAVLLWMLSLPFISQAESTQLAQIFPTSCHFSGTFTQNKHIEGISFPLQSEGDFYFSCNFGLVWNTITPFPEALLYANARMNYRVDEQGKIEEMPSTTRYVMSQFFLRLLKGDAEYFENEFSVSALQENQGTLLVPKSDFMKRGLKHIKVNKRLLSDSANSVQLDIEISDATNQVTHIVISDILEYEIEDRQAAVEQCLELYPRPLQWCRLMRSPGYYNR
ncbi:outer membrane lipoprotein carrier protein LolA [Alteromonas sediminis]|uniref:Outer membrane lipoprotein carrier protein LolA n=1 Tax=Alteromonas sediminis TaxID=2259342 RepID=A0A3N5Y5B1_9ALTE|nr:outer membrane lipoprotein carrier protein LolA [Alteromonas sediminis]RPJ65409.1 outer membrane lipoprotein carrier protein LolA [Alteromonas sediminis]